MASFVCRVRIVQYILQFSPSNFYIATSLFIVLTLESSKYILQLRSSFNDFFLLFYFFKKVQNNCEERMYLSGRLFCYIILITFGPGTGESKLEGTLPFHRPK